MKIQPGQPLRQRGKASQARKNIADGQFQVLLDGKIISETEEQRNFNPQQQHTATNQHRLLLGDATRLLDEAIEQIESDNAPREKTVESLQQLRKKLSDLGTSNSGLSAVGTILAVEAERLKSW